MADYKSTHTGEQIDTAIDNANSNWSLLMANLGVGRWANQTFINLENDNSNIYDSLAQYYTNYLRTFQNVSFIYAESWGHLSDITCKFTWHYSNGGSAALEQVDTSYQSTFHGAGNSGYGITIPGNNVNLNANFYPNCSNMFNSSKFKFIKVDTTNGRFGVTYAPYMFDNCQAVEEISGFAFKTRGVYDIYGLFSRCPKLARITDCILPRHSFGIDASTQYTEEALVEIIDQLPTVSNQTLTMGATNLAKLTDEEKKVATDKGWVLA